MEGIENIAGNREKYCLPVLFYFLTTFSTHPLLQDMVKFYGCLENGNTLPNEKKKKKESSKSKAFSDDKINENQKLKIDLRTVENIVRKGQV